MLSHCNFSLWIWTGDEDTKEDAGPSQAPRELPPWLRAQNNGAGQSSSQSAFGGNTSFTDALLKEDLDVKQAKEDEEASILFSDVV